MEDINKKERTQQEHDEKIMKINPMYEMENELVNNGSVLPFA